MVTNTVCQPGAGRTMAVTPPRQDADMRTVVAHRRSSPAELGPAAAVAEALAETAQARALRCDATAMVERMAARGRAAGLDHPVAAAVALATRVGALAGPDTFAERHGIAPAELAAAEEGDIRFGALPPVYGALAVALGLDLLSLADLEATWVRLDVERGRPR